MTDDETPESLKGWLDKPPLSEWTEEERQYAWMLFTHSPCWTMIRRSTAQRIS